MKWMRLTAFMIPLLATAAAGAAAQDSTATTVRYQAERAARFQLRWTGPFGTTPVLETTELEASRMVPVLDTAYVLSVEVVALNAKGADTLTVQKRVPPGQKPPVITDATVDVDTSYVAPADTVQPTPIPEPTPPPPPDPEGVFWNEGFEGPVFLRSDLAEDDPANGKWRFDDWSTPSQQAWFSISNDAHSGQHSLQLEYTDLDRDWGPFIWRPHQRAGNVYIRYWIKALPAAGETAFVVAPKHTKLVYAPRSNFDNGGPGCLTFYADWVVDGSGGYGSVVVNCQSVPGLSNGIFHAIDYPRAVVSSEWHCVEYQVDHGTPGVADGMIRAWWDGDLVWERGPLQLLTTPFQADMAALYLERGKGRILYDELAVSSTRIGC